MGTNDILNAEGNKDLVTGSVQLGVKDVFVSSKTVNT